MKWILAALLTLAAGCAFIKPTTEVAFNPVSGNFRLTNTKDVTVLVGDISVSKNADGTFSCAVTASTQPAITIEDKASPVIEANVQQMLAFVEQQKAANEGIRMAFEGISGVLGQLTGMISKLQIQIDAIGLKSTPVETVPGG